MRIQLIYFYFVELQHNSQLKGPVNENLIEIHVSLLPRNKIIRITRYWEKNVETVYIIWESGTSVGTLCEKDSHPYRPLCLTHKDLKRRNI